MAAGTDWKLLRCSAVHAVRSRVLALICIVLPAANALLQVNIHITADEASLLCEKYKHDDYPELVNYVAFRCAHSLALLHCTICHTQYDSHDRVHVMVKLGHGMIVNCAHHHTGLGCWPSALHPGSCQ